MTNFKGIYTAMITPFHPNGTLDLEGYLYNVQEQIEAGIHGMVIFGSTGESMSLTEDEIYSISKAVIQKVDGKIPLIFGATLTNTNETIKRVKTFEELGADALIIAPPPYCKPTQEGLYQHFSAISDATALPILLYNNPGRCGVHISEEVQKKLSFAGMKDCSGKIESYLNPAQPIITGDDCNLLPGFALGGKAIISILSNVFPAAFVRIFDLCQNNDFQGAYAVFQEIIPFVSALSLENNPVVVKKLMQLYDKPSGTPRLPLTEATEATTKVLRAYAEKYQFCPS